ncbi:ANTAR domain-containing protein [Streptomyces sp. NPDC046853]|uniref:ANTAR domain-containing protein n=1 Tax=Streptomyces sp. NPDC046853 TaxID=3154920 RepID=UPI0033E090A7
MLAEAELTAALVQLAQLASARPLDGERVLIACADSGRRALSAHAAVVRYAPPNRSEVQVLGTSEALRALALNACTWGEGPGHDTQVSGCALLDMKVTTAAARRRWPRWAPQAAQLGYSRVTALPLDGPDGPVGALLLLDGARGDGGEQALSGARALADMTAHLLSLQDEAVREHTRAGQLTTALATRVAIEQAKGILAARHHLTVDEAFTHLRSYARSHRRTADAVARAIIEDRLDPLDQAPAQSARAARPSGNAPGQKPPRRTRRQAGDNTQP